MKRFPTPLLLVITLVGLLYCSASASPLFEGNKLSNNSFKETLPVTESSPRPYSIYDFVGFWQNTDPKGWPRVAVELEFFDYDAPRKLDRELRCKLVAKGAPNVSTQNVQQGIQSESGVGSLQGTTHDQ